MSGEELHVPDIGIELFERLGLGCQVLDFDSKLLYLNGSAAAHSQRSVAELVGGVFFELFESSPLSTALRHCLLERESVKTIHRMDREDGQGAEIEWHIEPVPQGAMILSVDLGERVRGQENLERLVRLEKEATQRSRARVEILGQASRALSEAQSVEAIAEVVKGVARELVGAEGVGLVLTDGTVFPSVDDEASEALGKSEAIPFGACLRDWVRKHGEALSVSVVRSDARFDAAVFCDPLLKAVLIVPIRRSQVMGSIGVYWSSEYSASEDDVVVLQALADSVSTALQHIRTLEKLEEGQARSRAFYDHFPNAAFIWRRIQDGVVLVDFNQIAELLTEGSASACLGRGAEKFPLELPGLSEDLLRCLEQGGTVKRELRCVTPVSRQERYLALLYAKISADMVVLHAEDVTNHRRLEAELQQVQRIEAVGRLAGGLAHAFTNLLSVILSYAGFIRQELGADDRIRDDIDEILAAGRSAAELTRQLLAFGRRQVLHLELLSLNVVVTEVEGILRKFLPEDIDVSVHLASGLGMIEGDATQLEQVVVNLALWSKDAMPKGGQLTIVTSNVELSGDSEPLRHGLEPGAYVLLRIQDNGQKMSEEMRLHLFEPFFAATESNTALALATVYGIVRQCGGAIEVESSEQGTMFALYFPRKVIAERPIEVRAVAGSAKTSETILVVEDSDPMRRLVERMLTTAGFQVLSASSGDQALMLCTSRIEPISLLLSDVVMPQMGGRELWERLSKLRPELRVLFMSGYPDEALAHHGVMLPGIALIGKPFTAEELIRKVREVLDSTPPVSHAHPL